MPKFNNQPRKHRRRSAIPDDPKDAATSALEDFVRISTDHGSSPEQMVSLLNTILNQKDKGEGQWQ